MNMFARFNENPAVTLQDIKETKRYGRTDARTDGRTDNVKTVYPPQTKFAGGIKICCINVKMGKMYLLQITGFPYSDRKTCNLLKYSIVS